MEDFKINKKIVWAVSIALVLAVGSIFAGVYGFRRALNKIPSFASQKLAEQGITFKYGLQGISRTGSSVDVYDISTGGEKLPYLINGKGIGLDIKFGLSPLVKLNVRLNRLSVSKNPDFVEDTKPAAPPSSSRALGILGALLKFTYITFEVVDASFKDYGISDLSATAGINSVKLYSNGLESITWFHEMTLSSLESVPWFPGIAWRGTTTYRDHKLEIKGHNLGLGLFATTLDGSYDFISQKWSADITIPDGAIKNKEQIASHANAFWLTSASGEIGMKISLQGVGSDTASIIGEGTARAKDLILGVNHNFVRGNLKANLDLNFKKSAVFELAAKLSTDLTDALVVNKDEFRKAKDIPLSLEAEIEGKENSFEIKSAEVVINNLRSKISGVWSYAPQKTADIKFDIEPVNLAGWQQFFPKYPSMIAQGTLAVNGSYHGPTEDWKIATIELNINAQRLKFPILKIWNTSKDFQIEGVTQINSETSLSLASGSIKNLATTSTIELKDTKIKYGTLFNKEEGTHLDFDLIINSTKNQAEIKKGTVRLGELVANAKGKISNFDSPVANLGLQTEMMELTEIFKFLPPSLKLKTVEKPKGEIALRAKISGSLLSKAGADYSADVEARKVSFVYNMEDRKKKIEILNVTGPLTVTPNTFQTKKLFIQAPNSEGYLDMSVNNFEEPDIMFSFQGNRFALKDFYEETKVKPIEVSAAGAAATASAKDDFRKMPLLQKLKLRGDASVKVADLGYTTAENLLIKMHYDKLKLSVQPMSFNAFGGFISSDTDWDGTKEQPTTIQSLKVTGVDANKFLTSYSPKAKDVVLGKLNTDFKLIFSGMKPDEIQSSMKGKGDFALLDGTLKTIRFTTDPMTALKKVPLIGNHITKTDWDERFNDVKGAFAVENGKLLISNIIFNSPFFEARSQNATVGFDQSLNASVVVTPKESMLPPTIADIIRDENGKPSLPITITGNVQSPAVGLDTSILVPRTKNYLARQADKEKERALSEIKNKATEQTQKLIKGVGKGLFKQ